MVTAGNNICRSPDKLQESHNVFNDSAYISVFQHAGFICSQQFESLVYSTLNILAPSFYICGGRDSSVGIATRYGLDGPGIESRWWKDLPHPSRPALEPTQPPVQWVPGVKRPGRGADLSPQSSVPRS